MPLYNYIDRKSEKTLSVLRSFSEYDVPPTEEEATKDGKLTIEEFAVAEWERIIGANQTLRRGPNWRGAKGFWGKV